MEGRCKPRQTLWPTLWMALESVRQSYIERKHPLGKAACLPHGAEQEQATHHQSYA